MKSRFTQFLNEINYINIAPPEREKRLNALSMEIRKKLLYKQKKKKESPLMKLS